MITDSLRRLDSIAPLSDYSYVGFGALEFVDFAMFHRALGIENMVSIEHDSKNAERYEFNIPFNSIKIKIGEARDVLPLLDWSGLAVVWLDFEGKLDTAMIRDCELLARSLRPGSVMIVTINCFPDKSDVRVDKIVERLGEFRLPGGLNTAGLSLKNLHVVQRAVLTEAIQKVARSRHDPVELRQFLNFRYADGSEMQTLGWVVAGPTRLVSNCRFHELPFYSDDENAFEIKVPVLTAKEVAFLKAELPVVDGSRLEPAWLSRDEAAAFERCYRWYPEFMRIV